MWELFKRVEIPLRVAAVIALAYLGYVLLARHTANRRWDDLHKGVPNTEQETKFTDTYGGTAVKITQFYAREGAITTGQETVLCYGVVNAKSVKIEPPVGNVLPRRSIIACPLQPGARHHLPANGRRRARESKTASFTLSVKPDTENLPKITSFFVIKHSFDFGKHYFTISYAFVNANKVSIDPQVFSPLEDSAPFGQTVVAPDQTTTYT